MEDEYYRETGCVGVQSAVQGAKDPAQVLDDDASSQGGLEGEAEVGQGQVGKEVVGEAPHPPMGQNRPQGQEVPQEGGHLDWCSGGGKRDRKE